MSKLDQTQIEEALKSLDGWSFENNALSRELSFESYMEGIDFVNRLSVKAEENNHHPDLEVGWCRVLVTFTSHDSGGVTKRDVTMAKAVENLLSSA